MSGVRNNLEKAWFSLLLFGFICIGTFRVFRDPSRKLGASVNEGVKGGEGHERQLKELRTLEKHVTKSLNALENEQELSDHVLFFNRVPKCGSEMLVLLLQWMQGGNTFRHVRLPGGEKRRLTHHQQAELVDKIAEISKREAVPVSFDRHVYFLNFTDFGRQSPMFINLVRDPVDKLVSRFYYGRVTPNPNNPDIKYARRVIKPRHVTTGSFESCVTSHDPECSYDSGKTYDLAIPYFCGHDEQCMVLNDVWALQRAKKNIEKYFPVVGVLEELNATLAVLEHKIPMFFKGVQDMYYLQLLEPHRNANRMRPRTIDPFVRSHLKSQLSTEYDLYYWLKSRIVSQSRDLTHRA